jgi:hypothetical protein
LQPGGGVRDSDISFRSSIYNSTVGSLQSSALGRPNSAWAVNSQFSAEPTKEFSSDLDRPPTPAGGASSHREREWSIAAAQNPPAFHDGSMHNPHHTQMMFTRPLQPLPVASQRAPNDPNFSQLDEMHGAHQNMGTFPASTQQVYPPPPYQLANPQFPLEPGLCNNNQ